MPAPASPCRTASRLLNKSARSGTTQSAPATTLAIARPRCTAQTITSKIVITTHVGISHVHGYGLCRRDLCDIKLPPTLEGRTSALGGHTDKTQRYTPRTPPGRA